MAHYAEVKNGIVTQVIVAEQDFIDTLDNPNDWVQTSYNTRCGKHRLGGKPLRKNFAAVGGFYDKEKDEFIPPKDYPSWVYNEETCLWNAPIPYPQDDKEYEWDEETTSWKIIDDEIS